MAAAIAFECDISERAVADFTAALARYQAETQRDMRSALRSATIDLVKSLRAQTRKAPKIVPRDDVRWGDADPKYITGRDGRQFRRVVVARWFHGNRRQLVRWQPVENRYRTRMGMRNGNYQGIVKASEATPAMLRSARQNFGKVRQWGLAKKSWGWFMKSLFGASMQDENPAARVNSEMVGGGIREFREALPDGTVDNSAPIRCDIDIVNRLDYVRKAMPPGAVAVAVQRATNSINKKVTDGLRSRRFGS